MEVSAKAAEFTAGQLATIQLARHIAADSNSTPQQLRKAKADLNNLAEAVVEHTERAVVQHANTAGILPPPKSTEQLPWAMVQHMNTEQVQAVKLSRPARKGGNPSTKEPCESKARPAWKTEKLNPMKKLKHASNLVHSHVCRAECWGRDRWS